MLLIKEELLALKIVLILNEVKKAKVDYLAKTLGTTNYNVHKIARKLVQGDLISSRKGNKGGYELSSDIDKISLLDIHKIINGKQHRDIKNAENNKSHKEINDKINIAMKTLQLEVSNKLDSISLKKIYGSNYNL